MHPDACSYLEKKKDSWENLKREYDSIKSDIDRIGDMEISVEAKKLPLEELQEQIDNVKERMHGYIDTL